MSYTDFSLYLRLYDRAFTQTPEYAALNTLVPPGAPQQTWWQRITRDRPYHLMS